MAKVDAAKLKNIATTLDNNEGEIIHKAALELEDLRNKVGRMKITIKKKDRVIRTIEHHNNRLNNDNWACRSALEKLRGENERLRVECDTLRRDFVNVWDNYKRLREALEKVKSDEYSYLEIAEIARQALEGEQHEPSTD